MTLSRSDSNPLFAKSHLSLMQSLQKAAADTASITGGKLDYLIANAALVSQYDAYSGLGDL
jgi:hypothetical protein